MKILSRPRQGGKTTRALDWLLQDPPGRAIAVVSEGRRQNLLRQLRERAGMQAPWGENCIVLVPHDPRGRGATPRDVVVDDAEDALRFLVGPAHRLVGITVTSAENVGDFT